MIRFAAIPHLRVKWAMKAVSRGAYVVWGSIGLLFIVARYRGLGDDWYWLWALITFSFSYFLHYSSRRSDDPLPIIKRELIAAAFLQGVAVTLIEIQPFPSMAIIAPISAFALIGGAYFLLFGLLSCGVGIFLGWWLFGVDPLGATPGLDVFAIGLILIYQIQIVSIALVYGDLLLDIQECFNSPEYIDSATGLKTQQYFRKVISDRLAAIKESLVVNNNAYQIIAFYLIKLEGLDKLASEEGSIIKNKLLSEFSQALLDLLDENDLAVKWNKDSLLVMTLLTYVEDQEIIREKLNKRLMLEFEKQQKEILIGSSLLVLDFELKSESDWDKAIQECQLQIDKRAI